jgi:hypothetical protein
MEELKSMAETQKLLNKIQEDSDLARIEEMIKDNKIEFEHKDKKYRVRLMTLKEKEELNFLRLKKFGQLIKDKDVILERDLIDIYKEREIDIDKLDDDVKKIEAEIFNLRISLGEAISKNDSESILREFKDKILLLEDKKKLFFLQKTDLLQMSLENQLLNYVAEVVTYLTLDIYENEKWNRAFLTYNSFIECDDEELINKAGTRSMLLQYM